MNKHKMKAFHLFYASIVIHSIAYYFSFSPDFVANYSKQRFQAHPWQIKLADSTSLDTDQWYGLQTACSKISSLDLSV